MARHGMAWLGEEHGRESAVQTQFNERILKMGTKTYEVTLTGNTPLIMHQDSIEWSERVDRWLKIPENKKSSKAGDDRTPSWKWISGLYTDGNHVVVPSDNLMTCLREGGAKVTKSGKKTF